MKLELARAWHKEKEIMYNKVDIDKLVMGNGQFYRCYTDNGSEEVHEKLLDLMYDTNLIDNFGVKIITGDIIRIKIVDREPSNHIVMLAKKVHNAFNTYPVIDLHPQINTPSLGIGYVLSKYVTSIRVLGDIYTIEHGTFGGLG